MRECSSSSEVDSTDRRWQERANCLGVDPDLFFPERGASTKEAKSVCGGCEVSRTSASYALRHGEKFGSGVDVRARAPTHSPSAGPRSSGSRQRLRAPRPRRRPDPHRDRGGPGPHRVDGAGHPARAPTDTRSIAPTSMSAHSRNSSEHGRGPHAVRARRPRPMARRFLRDGPAPHQARHPRATTSHRSSLCP